ncbi:MAG: hypothetical protein JWM25_1113 [Thermoleophilia bacterium]|nr:hypothetical protein [Thermoleophilia bacterium]MCZ4496530.1 hypothetical protein [Thermoleophilia bacterium]
MPSSPSSSFRTIVICDDQAPYRFFLRALLEQHRDLHVVGEGWHGGQAIELMREHQPDVLVMDLAMPIMDGFAALPHALEASPDTQVLVLTGLQDDDPLERARELGAAIAVSKAIDPLELVAQVRELAGLTAAKLPS